MEDCNRWSPQRLKTVEFLVFVIESLKSSASRAWLRDSPPTLGSPQWPLSAQQLRTCSVPFSDYIEDDVNEVLKVGT